jgi:ubiquitin-conjugating enzyme E2 I
MKNSQGALDLKRWECMIPGRDKTIWEGALLKLEVQFPDGKIKSILKQPSKHDR